MTDSPFSVVVVAACPPPYTGQSVATIILLQELQRRAQQYQVIDIGREMSGSGTIVDISRFLVAMRWPFVALKAAVGLGSNVVFYLQLGQSTRALARDLPLLMVASVKGWPVVVHVHGAAFRRGFEACPWPLRRALLCFLKRAARAVVLCPRLKTMFEGITAGEKVVVVSNGVEEHLGNDALRFTRERRAEFGSAILYLSNLIDSKGYVVVLEAARLAQSLSLPHRFLIAGASTSLGSVEPNEFIQRHALNNVTYFGSVRGDEKQRLLRDADIFVLPTRYPVEGQPISILEAMHFGQVVITTRVGGIPDIIEEGVNGYFVEPDDPAGLLAMINHVADHPLMSERIAGENQRTARARYTSKAHVDSLLAVLGDAARVASSHARGQHGDTDS